MTYVNSQSTIARGVTVTIGGVKIGEIVDDGIPVPQTETDDIEVTNQDSGDWKEYKPGRKDGGECEIKGNSVPSDAGQQALAAASASGTTQQFVVTFPSGAAVTFYGVVKTFDQIVEDQILRFTSTVKVSGAPTFSTTDSALTGLTIDSQTMKPTFAADKFNYACDVPTGVTKVKVLPVQAEAGATITVNGVTVTSGNTGNIETNLGAAGTVTDIPVAVQQSGKSAVYYWIHVYRE